MTSEALPTEGVDKCVHLDLSHVTYSLAERRGGWQRVCCLREKVRKQILEDVTLRASGGEVTAVLGNSGSGKTSLLDVVACRGAGRTQGHVTYGGLEMTESVFRKHAGYVVQTDHSMTHLTVRETLMYTARLKYMGGRGVVDTSKQVDLALSQVGLRHVADSLVGGVVERGISGGEKRRLSIATQLIQDPALVLLDEPTTGLDSFTAHSIIQTLSTLAKTYHKIVLLSIHQPRSDIFSLFDNVGLLSQGKVVYYGKRSHLVEHFSQAGYPCPTYANPLDHYVDTTSIDRRSGEEEQRTLERSLYLQQYYQNSLSFSQMQTEMQLPTNTAHLNQSIDRDKANPALVFCKQTAILLKRLNINLWRSKASMFGRVSQLIFFGFLVWLYLFQLSDDITGIQDRTGLFFETVSATPIMGLLNAIAMFPSLRDLYYRESCDGLYTCGPFLTAYYIHILPFHLISSIVYSVWIYWGVGCYPEASRFFIFLCVVLMLQYLGELITVLFLCVFDSVSLAQSTNMLYLSIAVLVSSGLLRASSSMLTVMQWLSYTTFYKYAVEIVMANEYHLLQFECPDQPDLVCDQFTGDTYLAQFFPGSVDRVTTNFLALTAFIVGMWILDIVAYTIKGVKHLH